MQITYCIKIWKAIMRPFFEENALMWALFSFFHPFSNKNSSSWIWRLIKLRLKCQQICWPLHLSGHSSLTLGRKKQSYTMKVWCTGVWMTSSPLSRSSWADIAEIMYDRYNHDKIGWFWKSSSFSIYSIVSYLQQTVTLAWQPFLGGAPEGLGVKSSSPWSAW